MDFLPEKWNRNELDGASLSGPQTKNRFEWIRKMDKEASRLRGLSGAGRAIVILLAAGLLPVAMVHVLTMYLSHG
jgi:hypothetical protein